MLTLNPSADKGQDVMGIFLQDSDENKMRAAESLAAPSLRCSIR